MGNLNSKLEWPTQDGSLLEMAALGRPFQVGMLYDCRTDLLIPDVTLWDLENLKKDLKIKYQKNTQVNIITLDSLDEKTSILNMTASLKASFLCGLIEADGAAKYLNDTKSSKRQSRVTLHYGMTTRMEHLSWSHLGNQNVVYPEVFEQKLATHVVIGVLYGAQAFFVFDKRNSKEEQSQDITQKLEILIQKCISEDGKDLKMTDTDKKITDHLNCTFYSFSALHHNPTSFQDAMEIYSNLPSKLGKDDKLTVPILVWLYPLKHLNSRAAQLVQEISVALVSKSQEVLEEIDEHIMRCNDIMNDNVVKNFPVIKKNAEQFKSVLNQYKCIFQKDLARVLPNIRGGGANEEQLADILKKKEESPFNKCAITTWLDKREKEISMLTKVFNQINKMKLDIVINDLDKYDTSIENIVCLTFTSLCVCQSYISVMKRYLQAPCQSSYHLSGPSEELIIQNFRKYSQQFIEFAAINQNSKTTRFLVHSIPDEENPGATVYLYKSGCLISHNFQLPSKPEPLVADSVTYNSVTLKLQVQKSDSERYRVEYKLPEDEEWKTVDTRDTVEQVTITKLRPNSIYQFRHRAICQVGVSQASEKIKVKTLPVKKRKGKLDIKHQSKKIKDVNHPGLYLLPLQPEILNKEKNIKKCTFGKRTPIHPSKTIMVLGATGSGKSTLINVMVNYILGVQWQDDFRFKLIHEETSRSQAVSQTSAVTAYEMNYQDCFKVPYSFIIIDTPGFGDTRGIEQDKQITKLIQECFSSPQGVQHINAVCFVVQASQARLTHAQKYIFDSILSIFGKDIANNILVLITFADGRRPPVLDTITESNIPFPKDKKGSPLFFKFNNSSLFANHDKSNSSDDLMFDKMFWDMGAKNMEKLFDSLEKMDDKSLALTKEVLEERRRLQVAVKGLQPQIKVGLIKLEEIRQTRDILNKHITDIESNKDFEYEVEETVTKRESIEGTRTFITNCEKCNFTCHYPCLLPKDEDKFRCDAMKDGVCTVCPGRCVWNVHSNQKYKFIYETIKVKRTYDELKRKYKKAQGELMTTEEVFKRLQHEYGDVKEKICKLIKESHESIKRLEEIALRPNPLSTPEYIELLIESEEQEAKPGWMERVKSLWEVKEQAVMIVKLSRNEELLPSE